MAIYQTYTIRRGDTLGGVAKAFNTTTAEIARLNGIENPNRISVGKVIRIRQVSDTYRVGEEGDTLASVAARAGVDPAAISAANDGKPVDEDIGGRAIVVPSASPPAGSVPPPEHQLGKLSMKYECGNRGPGTVSSGRGDSGGASYGSYQLASKLDRPRQFLLAEGAPFANYFTGLTQGEAAFTTAWKRCAEERAKAFGEAQHTYIKRTHYDPQCRKIRDETGFDVNLHSAALRDVVWSSAVQHGPGSGLITAVVKELLASQGAADYDKQLIDAIYLERGRRGADGSLVHFSKNSAAVQEGVAARFRSERADAQAMLAAETAKTTLSNAIINPPSASSGESEDEFLTRIASNMSDSDVNALLERYGDDETRADFESGRKVLVALRRKTNWQQAERGKYDDPMILVWKLDGTIRVKRLQGNTEPAGAYAFGHERAARGSAVDFNKDGKADLGRLRAGVYHYRPEMHAHLGPIFRARDIQVTDRDCNQDGNFTPEDPSSGDQIDQTTGTSMYIHRGGTTFTGSAGCQTLPPDDFAALISAAGKQPTLSYVLVNAD